LSEFAINQFDDPLPLTDQLPINSAEEPFIGYQPQVLDTRKISMKKGKASTGESFSGRS